jgi:aminoglycoside phosphotransferase (APT) family kinase protein
MPEETRYREPAESLVVEVVAELLGRSGDDVPPERWTWVRTGSASLVVLAGETAVRVARDDGADLLRSRDLVDALPDIGVPVPRSVAEPLQVEGTVAVATTRLRGAARPTGPAPVPELRRLLEAVHGADPDPVRPHLAAARSFIGGPDADRLLREDVVPLLPAELRGEALRRVDALAGLPAVPPALNHGDLAGSNVLWDGDRMTGLLDWDLAALDDPAEDVASLAGWHGFEDHVDLIADPSTAARARVFRDAFCLMPAGFALLRGRPDDEVQRALGRATARLRPASSPPRS